MNVQPNIPQTPKAMLRPGAQHVHFGAGPSGLTGFVDSGFKRLTADRTTQMLVEDFIGFGLMRTAVDLWRGKAYGNDQMNIPAASERMGRETASIFTDNVLAGLVAAGMGKVIFDKATKNKVAAFNNKFVDYPTLEAFQGAIGNEAGKAEGEKAFLSKLAITQFLEKDRPDGEAMLHRVWNLAPATTKQEKEKLAETIQEEAKGFLAKINKSVKEPNNGLSYIQELDKSGKPTKSFNLNSLLEDVHGFSQHMEQSLKAQSNKGWSNLAKESVERTLKAKGVTIPVGLGVAMLSTFAVPFAISGISRKFFGIDYYPGEIGLRKDDPNQANALQATKKSFWERHAPYLTDSLKQGNYWPLIGTLAPLPLAAGLLNTTKLNKLGLPVPVKSFKEWKHLFDYQKLKPFTAQQQMASLFALLITARLLNARSDNEYNERMLDSFVGWGAWIMGTPLLNKAAGNLLDKGLETKLVKADGSLRARAEIEALPKIEGVSEAVMKKTLNSHIWMNVGTTCTTMAGLGLFIPWLAIKMTQKNENRKQQLRAAQAPPAPPAQPTVAAQPKPWGQVAQPSPFAAMPTTGLRSGFSPAVGFNALRNPWALPNAIVSQG